MAGARAFDAWQDHHVMVPLDGNNSREGSVTANPATEQRIVEPCGDPLPETDALEAAMARNDAVSRTYAVELVVRRALRILSAAELRIIEGYYFDGRSMPQLSRSTGVPLDFVRIAHRRALARLEIELSPFVERMFGLSSVTLSGCAICMAPWRPTAEDIIDGKTPDTTWGQIAIRIERAVGWRPPCPQVLITHDKKHRHFEKPSTQNQKGESTCIHHIICADNTP